jgi:hypothetical protein
MQRVFHRPTAFLLTTLVTAALVVCGLAGLLASGCSPKKPLAPAASKEAMPGSAPPGGTMPAEKGKYMGSKMIPGGGPVGGGTVGKEGGKGGASEGRGATE